MRGLLRGRHGGLMRARGAIFLVPTTKDMLEEADLVLGRHKVLGLRSDNEPMDYDFIGTVGTVGTVYFRQAIQRSMMVLTETEYECALEHEQNELSNIACDTTSSFFRAPKPPALVCFSQRHRW